MPDLRAPGGKLPAPARSGFYNPDPPSGKGRDDRASSFRPTRRRHPPRIPRGRGAVPVVAAPLPADSGPRAPPPGLTVVLPAYRDAANVLPGVEAVERSLRATGWDYEILLIEDAGGDGAAEVIRGLAGENPRVRFLLHERNRGRGATVAEGIREARGEFAGYLDIDMEVAAHYLVPMVELLREGRCDLVVARRDYRVSLGPSFLLRHVLSSGYRRLVRSVLPLPVHDTEAGYKFFRRAAILPVLDRCRDPHWFWDTEVCVRAHLAGLRLAEVPALFVRRADKASTVRVVRDTWLHFRALHRLRSEIRAARRP